MIPKALPAFKEWVKSTFGPSDALIHVNVGMALFLALALLLRRRPRGLLIAWAVVVALQLLNEGLDAAVGLERRGWVNLREAWRDTAATVFWPTVLLVVAPLLRAGRKAKTNR